MKIYFYTKYERQGASSRYRTYQYQPYLRAHGFETRLFPFFSNSYLEGRYQRGGHVPKAGIFYQQRREDIKKIGNSDLTVIEKELYPYAPAIFEKKAFANAQAVALDFDDAIFANYQHHRNPILRLLLRKKIDRLLSQARGAIGGSQYLCDYFSRFNPNVWLVPTVVEAEKYTLHDHAHDGLITIGWIGTPWSARYLGIVEETLRDLSRRVPVRFVVVGASPPSWQGVQVQSLPWSEDKEADYLRWMDIGIMPLVDNPFERGKCGLKILQYMAAGAIPVASDVGGNKDLISHGVDGFLCRSSADWKEHLYDLANNMAMRIEMGMKARLKVEKEYSLEVWAPRLADIYRQCAGGPSSDS